MLRPFLSGKYAANFVFVVAELATTSPIISSKSVVPLHFCEA
jgi:hypothetical protein